MRPAMLNKLWHTFRKQLDPTWATLLKPIPPLATLAPRATQRDGEDPTAAATAAAATAALVIRLPFLLPQIRIAIHHND